MSGRFLYVFLDEAGNFDFSPGGTKYFILSAISKERPFRAYQEMTELKYNLVERGKDIEYFHASEDAQSVRNEVFAIIQRNLGGVRVDSLVVEKRKIGPAMRPEEQFYPRIIGYLLRYVLNGYLLNQYREVIVFTDQIPVKKKRRAIEKAAKVTLAEMLPKTARYRLLHHDSKSNMDLQIVDYCNWAIYRKWDAQDERSYQLIRPVIVSEFDFCLTGTTLYY
ncbi:MAG: DUF3800 domain-containing protein [Verrucomicrobiota bacterium]